LVWQSLAGQGAAEFAIPKLRLRLPHVLIHAFSACAISARTSLTAVSIACCGATAVP